MYLRAIIVRAAVLLIIAGLCPSGTSMAEDPPITRELLDSWERSVQPPTEAEFALYDPPIS